MWFELKRSFDTPSRVSLARGQSVSMEILACVENQQASFRPSATSHFECFLEIATTLGPTRVSLSIEASKGTVVKRSSADSDSHSDWTQRRTHFKRVSRSLVAFCISVAVGIATFGLVSAAAIDFIARVISVVRRPLTKARARVATSFEMKCNPRTSSPREDHFKRSHRKARREQLVRDQKSASSPETVPSHGGPHVTSTSSSNLEGKSVSASNSKGVHDDLPSENLDLSAFSRASTTPGGSSESVGLDLPAASGWSPSPSESVASDRSRASNEESPWLQAKQKRRSGSKHASPDLSSLHRTLQFVSSTAPRKLEQAESNDHVRSQASVPESAANRDKVAQAGFQQQRSRSGQGKSPKEKRHKNSAQADSARRSSKQSSGELANASPKAQQQHATASPGRASNVGTRSSPKMGTDGNSWRGNSSSRDWRKTASPVTSSLNASSGANGLAKASGSEGGGGGLGRAQKGTTPSRPRTMTAWQSPTPSQLAASQAIEAAEQAHMVAVTEMVIDALDLGISQFDHDEQQQKLSRHESDRTGVQYQPAQLTSGSGQNSLLLRESSASQGWPQRMPREQQETPIHRAFAAEYSLFGGGGGSALPGYGFASSADSPFEGTQPVQVENTGVTRSGLGKSDSRGPNKTTGNRP